MMSIRRPRISPFLVLLLLTHSLAAGTKASQPQSAQQQTTQQPESRKYRNIGILTGVGGGVLLGQIVGWTNESSKDDLPEILQVTAISAAGLAVAGYFIGRRLDKKRVASQGTWKHRTQQAQSDYAAAFPVQKKIWFRKFADREFQNVR